MSIIINISIMLILEIILGLLSLIIIAYWIMNERKKIILKNESWIDVKREIKSNIAYYIFLILLIFSIIFPTIILMFFDMKLFAVPKILIIIPSITGIISSIVTIILSLRLLRISKKGNTQLVRWETYLTSFLLVLYWIFYFVGLTRPKSNMIIPLGIMFIGILFSVRSIICKGKLNRIIGIVIMITFMSYFMPSVFIKLSTETKSFIRTHQGLCVKEGEVGKLGDSKKCCFGLSQVSNETISEYSGRCTITFDGSYYCTKCGNGKCESSENACRCPKDCK